MNREKSEKLRKVFWQEELLGLCDGGSLVLSLLDEVFSSKNGHGRSFINLIDLKLKYCKKIKYKKE